MRKGCDIINMDRKKIVREGVGSKHGML
jgi:hypothetical protein